MSREHTPQVPSAENTAQVQRLEAAGIQSLTIYVLFRSVENRLYSISDPTDYIVTGTSSLFAEQVFYNEARAIQECRVANDIAARLQHTEVRYFYKEYTAT